MEEDEDEDMQYEYKTVAAPAQKRPIRHDDLDNLSGVSNLPTPPGVDAELTVDHLFRSAAVTSARRLKTRHGSRASHRIRLELPVLPEEHR
jgi:hypothetical protein